MAWQLKHLTALQRTWVRFPEQQVAHKEVVTPVSGDPLPSSDLRREDTVHRKYTHFRTNF